VIKHGDTPPEVAAIQSQVIERMTVARRLELAFEMSEMALARARLRERHPDWGEAGRGTGVSAALLLRGAADERRACGTTGRRARLPNDAKSAAA
jgi:hypothetical protein